MIIEGARTCCLTTWGEVHALHCPNHHGPRDAVGPAEETAPMTTAVEDHEIEPCPDCKAGKHDNCTNEAFDPAADAVVPCPCAGRHHV